jgi:hypothetical protein
LVEPARHAYPALQLLQLVAATSEYVPAGHKPEHSGDGEAVVAPNVPAGHAVQFTAPALLNRPAGQAPVDGVALMEASTHMYPAAHGPEHDRVPTDEVLPKRPEGHAVHSAAPPSENVPTGQGVPDGDVDDGVLHAKPGAAVHGEHVAAAAVEKDPGLHATAVPLGDPAAHAKPATQSLHPTAPAAANLPGGHSAVTGVADVEPAAHA